MKKNRVVYLTRLVIAVCILATCLSTSVLAVSCTSSSPSYSAAIQEGQTAAQEMLSQNKGSAIAVALVDRERVIWTETFGLADREKGIAPSDTAMFGIGSVSKMFATIAAMRLVDLGLIRLDDPLVQHLPNFKMASPEYQQVTIRMLLDHSSGFPGTDYRNAETTPPLPGYLDQLLQSLSHERLKAPPGYTNVYCNDGFTLIEALVLAKTGKTYAQFVQEEILIPLGMAHTRYPLDYLAEGSFAKAYVQGVAQPQDFVNTLGSGGVYSTAPDMAQLARMFLGNGAAGKVRILSAESVAEMAKDQTADNFQPVRSPVSAFGLGWDTVTEPGLLVAGVTAWAKGGDSADYSAAIVVAPEVGLGAVAMGVSGFNSTYATTIAERVLLRALAENGRIAAFPQPLPKIRPTPAPVPAGLLASIAGEYASDSGIYRLQPQPDATLVVERRDEDSWTAIGSPLLYRADGTFVADANPLLSWCVASAGDSQFLAIRRPAGYGHYLDQTAIGQRVTGTGTDLSPAWKARLSGTWLLVNESSDSVSWPTMDPRLRIVEIPELRDRIAVSAGGNPIILDPSQSDTVAAMMLPAGRDINDLEVLVRGGEEWMRLGSYLHRPLATVPKLLAGATNPVTIGPEGYSEWRSVAGGQVAVTITIGAGRAWRFYGADFQPLANGSGAGSVTLPADQKTGWLLVFGTPGQSIEVGVK